MKFWKSWLSQKNRYIPFLILFPCLYFLGWIIVLPARFLYIDFAQESHSLMGTIITFLIFLLILPSWSRNRWDFKYLFNDIICIFPINKNHLNYLLQGFLKSSLLVIFVFLTLIISPYSGLKNELNLAVFINSLFLGLGVGFAEEIIFRFWLFGEIRSLCKYKSAIILQALIFSLCHLKFGQSLYQILPQLLGLFLLGLILMQIRIINKGSIWGAVGFHSGIVGIWFLLSSSFIELRNTLPIWFFGVSKDGAHSNPIAGLMAIFLLLIFYFIQLRDVESSLKAPGLDLKASSIGAKP